MFYVDGVGGAALVYNAVFQTTTPAAIGARGDNLANSFLGDIDEVSIYNRALTAGEIQSIFNAGGAGKCNDLPPLITVQPAGQTVLAGTNVTFSVTASGSPPLGYQWQLNSNNVAGANATLTLTNVQLANAGNYSVIVSNPFGTVTSSNALLTVNSVGSIIQVVSANAASGVVVVPINLVAVGDENALGFSINFDPTVLTVTGVTLGSGASGGTVLSNMNLTASGKLGVAVSLPANTAFPAGTQEVVRISFSTGPVTDTSITPISFGDQPTLRQVSNPQAIVIPATYAGGTVTIPFGFEGDVAPRHLGDGILSITDWVQVGRFVAGLDTTATAGEFQRADCAPRATLGDGMLTVADWVQAGRYAVGLDPLTPAGGPTQSSGAKTTGGQSLSSLQNRVVTVLNANAQGGQACDISIQLNSQGNENALGFSILFDPSVLAFTGASLGNGAVGAHSM